MSYRIAVCDDSRAIRDQITDILKRVGRELGESFEIVSYDSAEQLLFEYEENIHILILDIKMAQMSGMEAARRLRSRGAAVQIIFLTAMPEYAVEGYDVHAYSFLIKPVDETVLKSKIQALIQVLSQDRPVCIELKNKDGIDIVDIRSIGYIESYSHSIVVHFQREVRTYSKRMSDLEELLSAHDFFRVHKSYLINLREISRIGAEDVVMSDGKSIPVSRNRRKEFLIRFTEFIN